MKHATLTAQHRTVIGKQVRQLRRDGLVPAVMYGHGKTAQSISINQREFVKLYAETGSTTLIDLELEGKKAATVLIHEVQLSPRRREVEHVDLFAVNMKEKLRTAVPLVFVGTSDAVELLSGILQTPKDEVEVECLPEDLIQELEIDISILKTFDDTITVANITVPEGIVILDDSEEMVALVTEPASQEELDLDTDIVENVAEVESETESGTDTPPVEKES